MFLIFQHGPLRRISDKLILAIFTQKKTKKKTKGKQNKIIVFGKHKSCCIYVQFPLNVYKTATSTSKLKTLTTQ